MANGKPSPATFDLTARLKEQRAREVNINGRVFHPAPETTQGRARDRQLGRDQLVLRKKIDAATEEDRLDDLEELQAKQEMKLYEVVANRLVDETDTPPEAAWLSEHLPVGMVTDLLEFLDETPDDGGADDPS